MEKNADIINTNKSGEQDSLGDNTYMETMLEAKPRTPHTDMSPEHIRQKNNYARDCRTGWRLPKSDEPTNPAAV